METLSQLQQEGYIYVLYYSGLEEGFAGYAKSYQEAILIANRLNDLGNDSCYMPMYGTPYVEGSEYWGLPDSYLIYKIDETI